MKRQLHPIKKPQPGNFSGRLQRLDAPSGWGRCGRREKCKVLQGRQRKFTRRLRLRKINPCNLSTLASIHFFFFTLSPHSHLSNNNRPSCSILASEYKTQSKHGPDEPKSKLGLAQGEIQSGCAGCVCICQGGLWEEIWSWSSCWYK